MVLMFLAGLFGMLGLLLDVEPLLIANTPLQVIGLVIFLWRMRKDLAPSRWRDGMAGVMLRTAALGLVVAVVLTAIVVNKFVANAGGDEDSFFEEILPYLLNIGVVGFLVGLITESAVLKRIFTPILGVAILYGIYVHLRAEPEMADPAMAESG